MNRLELYKEISKSVAQDKLEQLTKEAEEVAKKKLLTQKTKVKTDREEGIKRYFIKNGEVAFYEPYYFPGTVAAHIVKHQGKRSRHHDKRKPRQNSAIRYAIVGHSPDFVDLKQTADGVNYAFDPHQFKSGESLKWYSYNNVWHAQLGLLYPVIICSKHKTSLGVNPSYAWDQLSSEPCWVMPVNGDVDKMEKDFAGMLKGLKRVSPPNDSTEQIVEAIKIAKVLETHKNLLRRLQ